MAETKSASRSGSKLNLNESTMPLLDEEAHEKAETPEKDVIEMKEKASTTSEGEKDDSNPEKIVINFYLLVLLFWLIFCVLTGGRREEGWGQEEKEEGKEREKRKEGKDMSS